MPLAGPTSLAALSVFAALLLTGTAVMLLIVNDWRLSIGLLAAQYVGVFILTGIEWPLAMAVTRLVAGWMAGAVLGMALLSLPVDANADTAASEPRTAPRRGRSRRFRLAQSDAPNPGFQLLLAALVGLAVLSQVRQAVGWAPGLNPGQAWGSLILIGLGLLKLCFHRQPFQVALGLVTLFSGFEILYAAFNAVPLVAALSASITLGIVLVGAYLMLAPYMEASE